jgi:hypothetical protein
LRAKLYKTGESKFEIYLDNGKSLEDIITRGPRAWRSADRKQTGKKPDFKICLICVFNSIS